jgi:hypothetical protein
MDLSFLLLHGLQALPDWEADTMSQKFLKRKPVGHRLSKPTKGRQTVFWVERPFSITMPFGQMGQID